MNNENVIFKAPPRLLLGAAFLFWGAMHGNAMAALAAALLVESRSWVKWRWEFGEKGFARAWQLSALILVVLVARLFQSEEHVFSDYLDLFAWLPFMMLPLGLAQQFCSDEGTPVTTFSFIARRKISADRRAGREVQMCYMQIGYPYFFLTVIAAGMGAGVIVKMGVNEVRYIIGVGILMAVVLLHLSGKRKRKGALGVAYVLALLMTAGMCWGGILGYQFFMARYSGGGPNRNSSFETQTSIGQVRKLQLSPKVREVGGDFESLLEQEDGSYLFQQADEKWPDFESQGVIYGMTPDQALIPHLYGTRKLDGVQTEVLTSNSMGAIQMIAPKQKAMEIELFADQALAPVEHDPSPRDILVPNSEKVGIDKFLEEMGQFATDYSATIIKPEDVSEQDFLELREGLRRRFNEEFQYTLFLTGANRFKPYSEFLTEKRKGHCEYFGGATTLLLRRMGIPSRYVVGFAVSEKNDSGEYLLRGQHAHAWSQAYVGGTWVNEGDDEDPVWRCRGGRWVIVDLTPPDWLGQMEGQSWMQGFLDWWQKAKTNLTLWFAKASVRGGFKIFFICIGSVIVLYFLYKLLGVRGGTKVGAVSPWEERVRREGLLRGFEKWLGRRAGPRCRFLRERLTAGYSKTSISLNPVDKAVLSVPNNSHQQNHSFRKLRFFTASPDSSEDFLQFKEFEDELHVTLSNSQLKVVLDGLTDVKRGGGDYCICDNNGVGLWLWWL